MTTTTPDYKLVSATNIVVLEQWKEDVDPQEVLACKASLKAVGTTLIPFIVVRINNDRGVLKYRLLHESQTAMYLAYCDLPKEALSACPAIVINESRADTIKLDAQSTYAALAQLDYCFGTEPEEQFEECPASYNDVQVFEVADYFLVVVHFNYRHDGPKFSRLLSKMPTDDYIEKLQDVDRQSYFEVAQWAIKK